MKQMAGYPMRIILGMFMILPFLSKIAVKGSHLLFGKPKNSLLDEGKEPEKTQTPTQQQPQLPPQLQQVQTPSQQTTTQTTTTTSQQTGQSSPSNLLNKYKNKTTTTTTTTQTSENKPAAAQEPVRTYIPSPVGVQIKQAEDLTAADEAMRRADLAEQQALQTLKMN